ncbi:hypothetical protein ACV1DR_23110, partial [Aeromonas jandaei]
KQVGMTIIGHSYSLVKSSTKCAPALGFTPLTCNERIHLMMKNELARSVQKLSEDANLWC